MEPGSGPPRGRSWVRGSGATKWRWRRAIWGWIGGTREVRGPEWGWGPTERAGGLKVLNQ